MFNVRTFSAPVQLTEREWLQSVLDRHASHMSGSEWHILYRVGPGFVTCELRSPVVGRTLRKESDKAVLASTFRHWAQSEKTSVITALSNSPSLSHLADTTLDFRLEIYEDDGKASIPVCSIVGDDIKWHL